MNFENSDNVTFLLVQGFSGLNGNDLDTNDDGTLDVTPWTAIADSVALILAPNPPPAGVELAYSANTVGPDGTFVPGHAFRCDETFEIGAFDPVGGDDTPGAANDCTPPSPCGDGSGPVPIHTLQGDGAATPCPGQEVTTSGIVTSTFTAERRAQRLLHAGTRRVRRRERARPPKACSCSAAPTARAQPSATTSR